MSEAILREWTGSSLRDRIDLMTQQVYKSIRDPLTHVVLAQMLRACPERDDMCDLHSIFDNFKSRYRYTPDVREIDTFFTLRRMWELGGGDPNGNLNSGMWHGDCDDAAGAIVALTTVAGFKSGFKVIAPDGKVYSHVYAVAEIPRTPKKSVTPKIIPMDATVRQFGLGQEPDSRYTRVHKIYWYAERSSK
jgi:hypothetical protein